MILQDPFKKPIFPGESFQELFAQLLMPPSLALHLWWCPNGCVAAYAPWPRRFAFSAKITRRIFDQIIWTLKVVKLNARWCPSPCLVAVDLHIKYQVWMKLTISSFSCPLITPTRLLDMISSEVRWGRYRHHDHLACSSMTATYISWMWPPSWDALTQMYMFGLA